MAELEINNTKELEEKLDEVTKDNPNKPTEEEIETAKFEFEKAAKDFSESMWTIGEISEAQTFADYLLHYIRNRLFWTKNGWMGVIKLTEEIEEAEKLFKANKDLPLKIGYQALEFTFYSLSNPGGIGIQSALDFESENEVYVKLFDSIGKQLEEARKQMKEIQFLQDKWASYSAGYYFEIEPGPDEKLPISETEIKEECKCDDPFCNCNKKEEEVGDLSISK